MKKEGRKTTEKQENLFVRMTAWLVDIESINQYAFVQCNFVLKLFF